MKDIYCIRVLFLWKVFVFFWWLDFRLGIYCSLDFVFDGFESFGLIMLKYNLFLFYNIYIVCNCVCYEDGVNLF